MAKRAKMTERGCYTVTPRIEKKLRELSYETGKSQSQICREALDLYFDLLDMEKIEIEDVDETV